MYTNYSPLQHVMDVYISCTQRNFQPIIIIISWIQTFSSIKFDDNTPAANQTQKQFLMVIQLCQSWPQCFCFWIEIPKIPLVSPKASAAVSCAVSKLKSTARSPSSGDSLERQHPVTFPGWWWWGEIYQTPTEVFHPPPPSSPLLPPHPLFCTP